MPRQELALAPMTLDLAWKDPVENLRRLEEAVRRGLERSPEIPSEARLFLFPELTLTGFVTKGVESFSLEPPHRYVERLMDIARKARTGLSAGFPEPNPADPARPFNTTVVIGPDGKVACRYHKIHLFTLGKNPESAGYSAGFSGAVFEYRGWRVGIAVCFDIRFPALFHEYARAGVDLMLVPACWIGGPHKSYQFKTVTSAYAVLTQAYVAAVNRSGKDPFFEYEGTEHVFSPFGENGYEGEPLRLDPAELERCRELVVRTSDRDSYQVRDIP
ncbi:MAG: carbon-nitrogen hydrolase family protein [Elusimicrobiota bacterium]